MSSLLLGRERRTKRSQNDSESEAGASDSNSLSGESESGVNVNFKPPRTPTIPAGTKRGGIRRNSEWEIIEGLRHGERYEEKPQVWKGFLEKKRKWPLKGWHKRYFVLDDGILKYGKSPTDVSRGKIHGWVDIGLSVISTKSKSKRIDIDAEEFIYHLKAKQYEVFEGWAEQLKKHRLYRQHLLTFGSGISASPSSVKQPLSRKLATEGSPPQRLHFIMDGPLQVAMTELNHTQQSLIELSRILEMIEHGNQDNESIADGLSPNVKKDRKRFGLRKKKSNKGSSVDLSTQNSGNDLSPQGGQANRQNEIPSLTVSSIDPNLASDFYILAKDICSSLKSVAYTLRSEKERLAETAESSSLRLQLSAALRQNTDLRTRLQSVHRSSDLSSLPEAIPINGGLKESLSRLSCSSEYQDAKESLSPAEDNRSETSSHLSQSSEDLSGSSLPESDLPDSEYNIGEAEKDRLSDSEMPGIDRESLTGRRSRLPAPQPPSPPSLWELLSKNIGKDLSQVSMPVSLNEPLNMLQRLCEELEYSELLDKAAELNDPFERMTYVAAFAVSAYGSTYFRAGSKPFNPLLGETFECIREDKGFKFIAEQVSHHPPISVCHASSKNFVFWADSRIKTKFWGRSMEFQPIGHVNVRLERPNNSGSDVYRWNKVTSCVHNLFGGQRWVDQYGDLIITSDHSVSCKLNFVKASFWSQKKHEVIGQVIDQRSGEAVRKLFGKWSEALYCGEKASSAKCIWRQGTMPPNHEMYYGFTRFAIELNELPPDMVNCLPVTDTRFRPDQRLLEEGKIDEAESAKQRLEQAQRERRKRFETENFHYQPKWFRKVDRGGNEEWELTNYWEVRKSGFVNANLEPLW